MLYCVTCFVDLFLKGLLWNTRVYCFPPRSLERAGKSPQGLFRESTTFLHCFLLSGLCVCVVILLDGGLCLTCMHADVYFTQTYIHKYMHAWLHAFMHTCIHTYIHRRIYTNTYMQNIEASIITFIIP